MDKIAIDIGKKEFSSGLTYVACSRVRCLKHLLFTTPFTYQRLSNLSKSQRLQERITEDHRLQSLQQSLISVAEQQSPSFSPNISATSSLDLNPYPTTSNLLTSTIPEALPHHMTP